MNIFTALSQESRLLVSPCFVCLFVLSFVFPSVGMSVRSSVYSSICWGFCLYVCPAECLNFKKCAFKPIIYGLHFSTTWATKDSMKLLKIAWNGSLTNEYNCTFPSLPSQQCCYFPTVCCAYKKMLATDKKNIIFQLYLLSILRFNASQMN